MNTEFVGMSEFKRLIVSAGIKEITLLFRDNLWHLVAFNFERQTAFMLKERRGKEVAKTWTRIDRAVNFLIEMEVNKFTVVISK
ncbi:MULTISPECIES: hypothetical protein [Yersinia pseudotuberculosis complex]|uniref:Uncharacterized protein n=1 Tax=Yersinia pseudotuberculosis serotype O:1b (strain IP 31758) TaxID=349747 RepID=A0A0U1QTE3_YERP3|nr:MULTISPECIES: hypothetical protein [Yersinia pseudotuberculosis complex]ABS45652.1 hypothetical protein YpsIP31758_B0045 [Yersinia pseudotuberculosis IP 31758]MCE4113200.1 hypothetical protein [Yersinia pseudotuberculosis]UFA64037.1 Uncharacterized protein YP598_4428 [Yersinia pseudotuberculosis]WLF06166.1 hypothetical protein Q6G25_21470 [Yersinia pseudotuberculosis]